MAFCVNRLNTGTIDISVHASLHDSVDVNEPMRLALFIDGFVGTLLTQCLVNEGLSSEVHTLVNVLLGEVMWQNWAVLSIVDAVCLFVGVFAPPDTRSQ